MENRLARESSPYLRQHADNPVHWQPWDAAALAAARDSGRPILLSVGYSACHWCHVMAHECFEDAAIAALMNTHFVNVKVDREERPDLDRIYQLAHQALTGRGGGWPLTVFLTPDDLLPFFAGTYFPPTPRHGLPSFPQVLEGVARLHRERGADVRAQNARLKAYLDDVAEGRGGHADDAAGDPREALDILARAFDPVHGGHRGGPKFPHAEEMRLWLDVVARASQDDARSAALFDPDEAATIVRTTLDGMARGGLFDHLGGGFFRYCVDEDWTIPHFEKMLYDNAQLLPVYAEAALVLSEPEWLQVAGETMDFLERALRSDGGAFHCALDADSEGGEGAYYVWTPDEIRAVLPPDAARQFIARYGLDDPSNFEGHAWHLVRADRWHPRGPDGRHSDRRDIPPAAFGDPRQALRGVRAQRPPPGLDDKILTSWNALAIAGLARTARAAQAAGAAGDRFDPATAADMAARATQLAEAALDALHASAWRDGRLYADAHGRIGGFLDDHAFLLDALVEMLRLRWNDRDAAWAAAIAALLIDDFEDSQAGGFWFTPHAHEPLPHRPRPWLDESTPSGNAVAIRALSTLGHLFGEMAWLDAAERALRAGSAATASHPHAAPALLRARLRLDDPPVQVVVRATAPEGLAGWRRALAGVRNADVFLVPGAGTALPGLLATMKASPAGLAYRCHRGTCSAPVDDPAAFVAALDRRPA
jgi:uncharacterized protein YyaL (SSP411 family)